ncbi:MAG: zinc dependent phospholipase C family protein [Faecousia sp.]
MHAQSHYQLGQFLIRNYLRDTPRRYHFAFLTGCLEPDRNPITYLKGSIRCQWFRGHHWPNSHRYMQRIARRLERKAKLRLLDYYTLGKLIHYTADAFTFAHNEGFPSGLKQHRTYERILNTHFLRHLQQGICRLPGSAYCVMDLIHTQHRLYSSQPGNIQRDCDYAISVCAKILEQLVFQPACVK